MKRALLSLAIVAVCASGALATTITDMPTLTTIPSNFALPTGGSNTFDTSVGSCHIKDITGAYPQVLGWADVPSKDFYYIKGKITFDSLSELGFIARADEGQGRCYAGAINATDGHINLYKYWDNKAVTETADGFHSNSGGYFGHGAVPAITVGETYGVGLLVNGPSLKFEVWNKDFSQLLTSINATDDSSNVYTTGVIGVCAAQKTGAIEGTWSDMTVTVPEPGTVAILVAGALALLGWARLRRR